MIAGRHRRTLLLTVLLIMGLVTVAVPVCTTAACDLTSGMMPSSMTPVLQMVCDMTASTIGVVDRAMPPSAPSLFIGMLAVLAVAVLAIGPSPVLLRLPVHVGDPPAPPDDLRGVRLLI